MTGHLLTLLVAASVSAYASSRAIVHMKAAWTGKGKPHLWGVTARDVSILPVSWPFRAGWVRPQDAGDPTTVEGREMLHAYSRLAERAGHRASLLAQALVVLGSAWLGLTLPAIWDGLKWSEEPENPSFSYIVELLPFGVAFFGLLVSRFAHDYRRLSETYEQAAKNLVFPEVFDIPTRWERFKRALGS